MALDTCYDVVIVGGGPVGLVLACELGEHGIRTLLLEERDGPSTHPKANTHSARSMEIYRRLGLAAAFRAGGLPDDRATDCAYFTRLAHHELGRVPLPSPRDALAATRAGDPRWPTPEPQMRASQRVLEPLLLQRARSCRSVDVRFGWRVSMLQQDVDGACVLASPADGDGPTQRVACRYVAGCDGGRSLVRRAGDVRYGGEGGLDLEFMGGRMMATCFRAPGLLDVIGKPAAWQYWALNPDIRAVMVAVDGRQDFLLHVQLRDGEAAEGFDFAAALRHVVGVDVPHQVLSAVPWRAGQALVAERFRAGRFFLAGDAAHLFTPTGGFGVNTGVEDAVNLGWKLAGACQGWAGDALLDSYGGERRPVALRNTGAALLLARVVGACPVPAWIEEDSAAGALARAAAARHIAAYARDEFDTPGIQLGARYDGSPAIVAEDGAVPPPDLPGHYVPSAIPGGRAPHAWLEDGTPLIDRLGHRFTLLCFDGKGFGGQDAAVQALAHEAQARGMPFAAVDIADNNAREAYGRRFALIRPDQHVAWRGDAVPPAGLLLDGLLLGGAALPAQPTLVPA